LSLAAIYVGTSRTYLRPSILFRAHRYPPIRKMRG